MSHFRQEDKTRRERSKSALYLRFKKAQILENMLRRFMKNTQKTWKHRKDAFLARNASEVRIERAEINTSTFLILRLLLREKQFTSGITSKDRR